MKKWLILALALFALLWITCSKSHTSHPDLTEEEPVPPREAPSANPTPQPPPPRGPIAGSVYDVVPSNSTIPADVLQAMAKFEVNTTRRVQEWHTLSVDINDDGSRELLISNVLEWCGSGGCAVWLWQRTREGLRNLLPVENILAAALHVEESVTEGYHDIRIYHRDSGNGDGTMLVSDLFVWSGSSYVYHSTMQHGKYLETPLPENAWKIGGF